ncbi:hypothetical protein BS47DRAFT_1411035 [Hydnum rufescens UP504]|uniref:nicotinamidase n=1 Tax=Hydnum rufescens UP504 TaxID=1448309 RepID=A0A9P6B7Q6_9AGAM|nr:hypothetical protein BS47DRAFT_1411035 [Hydnum rufescens UP504]
MHTPNHTALLLVDVQNDFLPPTGSLAVSGGRDILPVIHRLLADPSRYALVVATQVHHPPGHISFASTHAAPPFTIMNMLWPDHCVQNTKGWEIEAGVQGRLGELGDKVRYIHKVRVLFADNLYTSFTSLPGLLYTNGIKDLVIVGLATDYCVRATAIDACKFGFRTRVVKDAVSAVDVSKEDVVLKELERWGCEIVLGSDVLA